MEEAFVTFATDNYFHLLKITLDSVKAFSKKSIIAYGINSDVPFSTEEYPMLTKRRFDMDRQTLAVYFQKPNIIIDSIKKGLKRGVYIEADDVLNKDVDMLFHSFDGLSESKENSSIDSKYPIGHYPLCPIHPTDPNNQQNIMTLLEVKDKSMPYVHGHVTFTDKCLPFAEEWYAQCIKNGMAATNYDETILNVLLWKYKCTKYLNVYDPYYENIHNYVMKKPIDSKEYKNMTVLYYMFHGCKDSNTAGKMLKSLIDFHATNV